MLSKDLYVFKIYQLVIVYSIFYIVLNWQINSSIFTNNYYHVVFGNQLSYERVEQIIQLRNKFQIIGYFLIPIFLLIKLSILSSIIYATLVLYNETATIKQCFRIAIIAELAIILSTIVKCLFYLFEKKESLKDLQFYSPLSLTHFFLPTQVPNYLVYPLQQINLFEFAYCFLMGLGIQTFMQTNFWKSLKITASSYGVAMLIWVLFIVFIQLQFS
jgi:hypothetical protein